MKTEKLKKKLKIIQLILLFSIFNFQFSIFNAIAAELRYFESLYDVSGNLTLATAGHSYQFFIPYDDYVSGFDIWVENEDGTGTASFGLRDINDNLLAAKTISIPYIARVPGGERLHVSFDQPVAVIANQTYKIKMLSSMPKLKVHYSNLVDVQVHNATNSFERRVRPAYIGANEQSFFFKFALYEDGDTAQSIVSNFSVSIISPQKTNFRFNANEPVDYKISYWPDSGAIQETNFFNNFYSCDAGFEDCVLEINTSPNTHYNYRLTVKDAWNNETNIDGEFISSSDWSPASTSTPPNPEDNSELSISNLLIVFLDSKSVKISWQTNKAANSSLLIILDAPGGQTVISVGDAIFELDHVLSTGNVLRAGTKYIGKAASIDANSNYAYQEIRFETLAGAPQSPPEQQNPEQQNKENQNNQPSDNQGTITTSSQNQNQNIVNGSVKQDSNGNYYFNASWSVGGNDQYGAVINGYRIDIFDNNKNLAKSMSLGSEKRSAVIEGLASGEYYTIVYSNNNGVFEKVDAPQNFKIPARKKGIVFGPAFYIVLFSFLAIAGIITFYVIKRKKIKQ